MPAAPLFLLPTRLLAAAFLAAVPPGGLAADFPVTINTDSGPGSLRQAILDANVAPGADNVVFAFTEQPGIYPVLNVTGTLPYITDPLTIVGKHQAVGAWGTVMVEGVEILSTGMAAGQSLLTVSAGSSTLKNLALVSNTAGTTCLTLSGQGKNLLDALQTGITYQNLLPSAGLHRIVISSDDNSLNTCRVGGAGGGDGIRITGSRNVVKRGINGIKPGNVPAAHNQVGIHLIGGTGNVIGGLPNTLESNQISASRMGGIHIEGGSGHRVLDNKVNDFNGTSPLANGTGTSGYGIRIDGGAEGVVVEGPTVSYTNGRHIDIPGPASNVRVTKLVAFLGRSHGIFAGAGVSGLTIEDSICSFSSGSGIHLQGGQVPSGPVLIRHNVPDNNLVGIDVVAGMGQVTIGTRRDATFAVSNKVFGNLQAGIRVSDPGARVRVSENSLQPMNRSYAPIYGIPINLQPAGEAAGAVTANDPQDVDAGPNGLQNFPVITAMVPLGGSEIRIQATLNFKPSTTYVLEALQHSPALVVPANLDSGLLAGYLGSVFVT